MKKHVAKKRYYYMHSGDCYLYVVLCSCGEKPGGWTPEDAEKEFNKHIEESKCKTKTLMESSLKG